MLLKVRGLKYNMKKSNIKQSIFTADNDLSKTQNTKEIVESMVVALNDHRIDDIGEFFSDNFNAMLLYIPL